MDRRLVKINEWWGTVPEHVRMEIWLRVMHAYTTKRYWEKEPIRFMEPKVIGG